MKGENCKKYTSDGGEDMEGWCFLEKVNEFEPTENCYNDIEYSERWGRYYSAFACSAHQQVVHNGAQK